MKQSSNIGETGVKSIRLKEMRVDDLPIAEAAQVKPQLAEAEQQEVLNRIADVVSRFPKQRVDYLKSRIAEAEANMRRMDELKTRETSTIQEYSGLASLCELRDKLIKEAEGDEAEIKKIIKQYPIYNTAALKKQITMCEQGIERANKVIAQEQESIAELRETLVLCQQRDNELRNLGAKVE